jgi:hypothetical protein
MSSQVRYSLFRLALLGGLWIPCLACASLGGRLKGGAGPESHLELQISLNAEKYQPGEPVRCELTLTNPTDSAATVLTPDHDSMAFSVQPKRKGAPSELRLVQPVASTQEPTGTPLALAPHTSMKRSFVFTVLTLERGEFLLAAVYSATQPSPARPAEKAYAKPVLLTVAGAKAFAHRYSDGLLAREDALSLAAGQLKEKVQRSDALLIRDEMGFLKWWVNLWLDGPAGQQPVKSYFVDPYLARVWGEAKPFTDSDRPKATRISRDSQAIQKMRDKNRQIRSGK